jgi:hypothetical protein
VDAGYSDAHHRKMVAVQPRVVALATYTFAVRINREPYGEGLEMEVAFDEAAVAGARAILKSVIDHRPPVTGAVQTALIGVGAGAIFRKDEMRWLGEWEWEW